LLLDFKDLRAIIQHVGDNAKTYKTQYGNITTASVGAIQRSLLEMEHQGAESLFGEPAVTLADLMQVDAQGRGVVNILAADRLLNSPRVYASFLLWLLSELFEELPEVGDRDKPKLVFFFDEAHLLFDGAPKALIDKIEQVVRLIRSKGVGVYFVTQSPTDIPDTVLGQLGNRVQHALRAFTPRDQKLVRAAAETFRVNPGFDVAEAITQLAVGEALVSLLDNRGMPCVVQRGLVVPPPSRIGPVDAQQRAAVIAASPLRAKYQHAVDRESAYEILTKRVDQKAAPDPDSDPAPDREAERRKKERDKIVGGVFTSFLKSAARSLGTALGYVLRRGVLGNLTGGSSRRKR
jgi:DNA helicase HerA-like ATPase